VSSTDRQFKTIADAGSAPALLDAATGLRYKAFNLDQEQARRLRERERYLQELRLKSGGVRKFEKFYEAK
jgi:hypothetical protein